MRRRFFIITGLLLLLFYYYFCYLWISGASVPYFLMKKGGGATTRPCLSSQGRHEPGPRGLRRQGPLWSGRCGEAPPRDKASVARRRHRTRRGCRHEAGRRLWGGMAGPGLLPTRALRSCGAKRGRQRRISRRIPKRR